MRKLIAPALAALVALTGLAVAQQYGMLYLPTLTGAERVIVSNGGPQITNTLLSQIRDGSGYSTATPTTGATVQAANNASVVGLYPAGTLAALTVNLPTLPFDGQRVQVFTSQSITAFTLTSGQTIAAPGAVTTLGANGSIEYFYVASTQTWNRIQ